MADPGGAATLGGRDPRAALCVGIALENDAIPCVVGCPERMDRPTPVVLPHWAAEIREQPFVMGIAPENDAFPARAAEKCSFPTGAEGEHGDKEERSPVALRLW
ncbi:hypothetical protein NDU88_002847 [Pleurodeles waltl]|uniref:Uncharacterized protein n=1 Tax=Pleurodeles waltl TaxID=8319 RepID=A0AAV7TNT4_PLEWA|nr:hypothetical protein NDU88_002847 [Pleurodeles waltl]